jgi:Mrp family chromosome partitioning ATPase
MEAGQEMEQIHDIYRAVLDNPFSHLSEQYKEISFAISKEHDMHQSNIYTCLSMVEGHGASSFLTNTLCSLKSIKGKKIMVDFNVWNPLSRKLVPDAEQGLWEVIEGRCDLKDAIVTDSDYPFHILPFGNWEKGQKSVFQEVGIDTVIEVLRLDYEYIMIDAPPLLLTTDAKFLAKLADVVVLVLEVEKVREKELFRAVKMLDKVDVQVVSIILNRVKFLRGKYYPKTMKSYYDLIHPTEEEAA